MNRKSISWTLMQFVPVPQQHNGAKLVALAVLLLASLPALNAATPPQRSKPNIVFILADDLGYGDLGCYGQKKFATPNIDLLAEQGMKLTQFYAGATVCAPSRCTLMTGLHNGHAPVRGNKGVEPEGQAPMPADTFTVARLLKQAGYRTALIGKWGLGYPGSTSDPLKMGFDYFFGYNCQTLAHHYYPDHLWRNDQRVELPGNKDGQHGQYSHDLLESEALKYVAEHKEQPFFLYLALTLPHAELLVPEDSLAPFVGRWPEEPFKGAGRGANKPGAYHASPTPRAAYAGMVTRMDRTVGRLLEELKQLGIDENTLVIFTSDNGPHKEGGATPDFFNSGGSLRGYKRDLYEGGIRVPFIARWPGRIKPGKTSDFMGYFGDFLVTAAELAGQPAPTGLDGLSFLPTLLGKPAEQQEHSFLYWEFYEGKGARALRKGDWKAVRPAWSAPVELYDLSQDLGEKNNLASEHPEIVKQLAEVMDKQHQPSDQWPPPGEASGQTRARVSAD